VNKGKRKEPEPLDPGPVVLTLAAVDPGLARRVCARLALDRWAQAVAEIRCRIRGRRSPYARSPRSPAAGRALAGCSGRRWAPPRVEKKRA
jgi:hypothetical protein